MPDMGAIASAIGSLKTAADITKGFLDLKEAAAVQGKVIELQSSILAAQSSALAAQSEQFTLLERVRELEAASAKLAAWEVEKKRYKLTDYGGGTFAYELRAESAAGEPTHRLCAGCFQRGQKSILQNRGRNAYSQEMVRCTVCSTDLNLGIRQQPRPVRVESRFDPFDS